MSASDTADHHDDPWSHVPPPSPWPFLLGAISLTILMFGILSAMGVLGQTMIYLMLGGVVTVVTLMGWAHQVIKEKSISHDLEGQQRDLMFFTKMFLISELAAFGAVFGYFFYRLATDPGFVPPPGINLGNPLIGFATILLLTSSVTCEIAHHAVMHGERLKARITLLSTIILGLIFLGFMGYEYGEFIQQGYGFLSMQEEPYSQFNSFMSLFFAATGFHGIHVLTGLVMLILVYVRLEMRQFTQKRHFSMMAASLYWHFVDIVWIFLFVTVYVISPAPGSL